MTPRKDRLSRHRPKGDSMYSPPPKYSQDMQPRPIKDERLALVELGQGGGFEEG
jgi:hypothetical protein